MLFRSHLLTLRSGGGENMGLVMFVDFHDWWGRECESAFIC